jgi:hypothetical protein
LGEAHHQEDATVTESGSPTLYAEMLPLVEAGASVEQAARRFGDEEGVAEIAAGFIRWRAKEHGTTEADAAALADLASELHAAQTRLVALEAENRGLRRELTTAQQAISRARVILDGAAE